MLLQVNDLKINYVREGNKEADKSIVLVHGSAMCVEHLKPLINLLPEYNVVAIDLIGHGLSEGVTPQTVKEYTQFVEDVLHTLHKENIIGNDTLIAGYSLGGTLVTEIALKNLPFVTGVGLFNTCDFKNTVLTEIVAEKFEDFDLAKTASKLFGTKSNVEYVVSILEETPQKLESCHSDLLTASRYEGADLTKIKIPIFIVAGEEDALAPIENVIDMYRTIPKSRLTVIPYHGHSSFYEVPEVYAEAIKDFLKFGVRA